MNNLHFLDILKASFLKYLETGARSNKKLKILHGAISKDLSARLDKANTTGDKYAVASLDCKGGKEKSIKGHYVNKSVDIVVSKDNEPIAGVAVKFVMSNYKQNSNNYFENMLGETANMRCNNIRYFQIFVIADKIPYFDKDGNIKEKWEEIDKHNLNKYIVLSNDNIDKYLHTPDKLLVFVVNISGDDPPQYSNRAGYKKYYETMPFTMTRSSKPFKFGNNVIYNEYETFINKIVHTILGI